MVPLMCRLRCVTEGIVGNFASLCTGGAFGSKSCWIRCHARILMNRSSNVLSSMSVRKTRLIKKSLSKHTLPLILLLGITLTSKSLHHAP